MADVTASDLFRGGEEAITRIRRLTEGNPNLGTVVRSGLATEMRAFNDPQVIQARALFSQVMPSPQAFESLPAWRQRQVAREVRNRQMQWMARELGIPTNEFLRLATEIREMDRGIDTRTFRNRLPPFSPLRIRLLPRDEGDTASADGQIERGR